LIKSCFLASFFFLEQHFFLHWGFSLGSSDGLCGILDVSYISFSWVSSIDDLSLLVLNLIFYNN